MEEESTLPELESPRVEVSEVVIVEDRLSDDRSVRHFLVLRSRDSDRSSTRWRIRPDPPTNKQRQRNEH